VTNAENCLVLAYTSNQSRKLMEQKFKKIKANQYNNQSPHRQSDLVFTVRYSIVQSAVLRSHVVCLSVCVSVCRWWIRTT